MDRGIHIGLTTFQKRILRGGNDTTEYQHFQIIVDIVVQHVNPNHRDKNSQDDAQDTFGHRAIPTTIRPDV